MTACTTNGRSVSRAWRIIVIGQIALTLVNFVWRRARAPKLHGERPAVPLGFDLQTCCPRLELIPPRINTRDRAAVTALFEDLLRSVSALPDVVHAGFGGNPLNLQTGGRFFSGDERDQAVPCGPRRSNAWLYLRRSGSSTMRAVCSGRLTGAAQGL